MGGGTRTRSKRTGGRGLLLATAHTMLTPPWLLLLPLLAAMVAGATVDGE